jgi:pyroglutamyl-peptidase
MCAVLASAVTCSPDPAPLAALLVTAFEPFGGGTINASLEAATGLDGWYCGGSVVKVEALSCAYGLCVAQFIAAYARLSPRAVLMTGQAARRAMVCVERSARNRANPTARDNLGALGSTVAGGPASFNATAPAGEIAKAIRAAGIAARLSSDAGDYVCNHLYYGALKHLAETASPVPALFIHVPATPEQRPGAGARALPSGDATRALKAALEAML